MAFAKGGLLKIGNLAESIARREGHASKSRIKDIEGILNVLSDMSYKSTDPFSVIAKQGIARAKKKKNAHPGK